MTEVDEINNIFLSSYTRPTLVSFLWRYAINADVTGCQNRRIIVTRFCISSLLLILLKFRLNNVIIFYHIMLFRSLYYLCLTRMCLRYLQIISCVDRIDSKQDCKSTVRI